jgi:glyoxylate reductase
MAKILVTRRLPSAVISKLEAAGAVDLPAGDVPLPYDELCARLADKDAVVTMLNDRIDQRALDGAPQLRIVANVAVGFNNVDVAYARSRGVTVTNTPGVLTESVADFTWALILGVTRRLGEGERLVRSGGWRGWAFDFMLGSELGRKQLGIIGWGRIGQAVAARAAAFGMRVVYTSRTAAATHDGPAVSLDRLLNTSDVVSLHVPLTKETEHLIDRRALTRMKRSAYLVNTTRGPVIDEDALAWALEQRLLAGAALDVYEREPEIHRGLLSIENVVLSPHLGSSTIETRTTMIHLAVDNIIAVLSGQPPITPV